MEPIEPSEDQERPPRQGWEDHSKQMAAEGEDKLLDADSLAPTQWDKEEVVV